jgi:murein DD-endopeptidase MepM/ murein hydrolase activator NlpD
MNRQHRLDERGSKAPVRRGFRALVPFLLIALVSAVPVTAGAQTREDVQRTRDAKDAAYERLIATNEELDEAVVIYEAINSELIDLNWRISLLHEQVREYEEDVFALEARARNLVIEAYMNGGIELMEVVLEAESIQDVFTGQVLASRATDHDIVALDRLDALSRELDRVRAELEVDQARAAELETEARGVVARLVTSQERAAFAYAEADQAAREAYRLFLEEQRLRRMSELARIQGIAGGLSAAATPGFVCPVGGSVAFSNDWGNPRSDGRTHKGTDMFARRGTKTVAVANGTIRLSTEELGGTAIYLTSDYGVVFYYAHLDRYASSMRSGRRVEIGEVIAYVGDTGNALGGAPHLHFQIHPGGGAPVNPYPTVRRTC